MPNTFDANGGPQSAKDEDLAYLNGKGGTGRRGANREQYRRGVEMNVENSNEHAKIMRGGKSPNLKTDEGLVDVMKANREYDDMEKRERRGK